MGTLQAFTRLVRAEAVLCTPKGPPPFLTDPMLCGLFKKEIPVPHRRFGVLVDRYDDCRDILVATALTGSPLEECGSDLVQALLSHGQMKPEQQEIAQLRREVTSWRPRDISKKRSCLFRVGSDMKVGFIAKHR